ncbi:SubName: Full=Uncharacterized protein {ECO:0000313/EMBL:CCA75045.1} [Serendipita indica DSM 11827]|nr:SubName: Full=Uncharacterized protein {ECO:0000313/EMBL:CCA75045.1} [Serendipita indica DSM 11827]
MPRVKPQQKTAERIFHPLSRKAGQLERETLRKAKLAAQVAKRGKKKTIQADRYAFFLHALPPDIESLSLADLHELIRDVWLTRHDLALEEEQASRRKGRPKSTKEDKLEEAKRRDAEEYATGLELPDLTDARTVRLFRQWDGSDVNYLSILRLIRVSGTHPDVIHVARVGRDKPAGTSDRQPSGDGEMEVDKEEALRVSRPGSTMLSMDEIPV